MTFMIDTSLAIPIRDGDAGMRDRVRRLDAPLVMSILSRFELESGVWKVPKDAAARRFALDTMLESIPVLPLDDECAAVYGRIVEALGYSRPRMFDRMIAAHAIRLDLPLISLNGADFRNIVGLKLEAWA